MHKLLIVLVIAYLIDMVLSPSSSISSYDDYGLYHFITFAQSMVVENANIRPMLRDGARVMTSTETEDNLTQSMMQDTSTVTEEETIEEDEELLLNELLGKKKKGRKYKYRTYDEMVEAMQALASSFPEYVDLHIAQDKYGLKSPGKCGVKKVPCKQYFMTITNKTSLNTFNNNGNANLFDAYAKSNRPQVFLSGAVHGDERIGPQSTMELAILLVNAASYKGHGRDKVKLYKFENNWIRRLLNTRIIVVIPMTNALGYSQSTRQENRVDPNRDYPFDNPARDCMKAVTSRTVNEIFREHLFRIAITFHAGMRAISYEWGTYSHEDNAFTPDEYAQASISSIMSAYAGSFQGSKYPHGRMNDIVYPVNGGMEDWAYAGSWDKKSITDDLEKLGCDGYDVAKTTYTNSQLRAVNILVETSDDKTPKDNTLGTDAAIFMPEGTGDGHVPRNIRVALIAVEFAQPYIQWVNPKSTKFVTICNSNNKITGISLGWEVGGSMNIDETELIWGAWPENIQTGQENLEGFGYLNDPIANLNVIGRSNKKSGLSRWAGAKSSLNSLRSVNADSFPVNGEDIDLDESIIDRSKYPFFAQFMECLFVDAGNSTFTGGKNKIELFFMVRAKVDAIWGVPPPNPDPKVDPQSHIVNSRTNSTWNMENNGYTIKGRTDFYSVPIKLVLTKPNANSCIASDSIPTLDDQLMIPSGFMDSRSTCKEFYEKFTK